MSPSGLAASLFLGAALAATAGIASAQNYPNRPVRIVTADAGGGADFLARGLAQELIAGLKQPVIVENRGGASGLIAIERAARAQPDGYTLLLYSNGMWTLPFLRSGISYHPVRDFAPITLATRTPNLLVVHPSLPANSVKELIELAKARPGQLSYASAGLGSSVHLAAALFTSMTGVNMLHVPYKGTAAAITDLIGGQVQVSFASVGPIVPHVKAGKLKALAITSAQPSPLLPNLPTVAATVPGYESATVYGVFAPAKTPVPFIRRLNQEILKVLNRPDVKEKFFNANVETVGSSPEQLAATMKAEMARMGKVIKDAGIRAE